MAKVDLPYTDKRGRTRVLRVNDRTRRINAPGKNIISINLAPIVRCIRLEYLKLYDNEIHSLDLSPLSSISSLREIILRNNKLESLDLSSLKEHANLERLDLRGNQIQQLDVSPLARHFKLERFEIEDNPLTELDISALFTCPKLKEVKINRYVKLRADRRYMQMARGPMSRMKKHVQWYEVAQTTVRGAPGVDVPPTDDQVKLTVLGLLKSVPRVSIEELTAYSEMPIDATKQLVFELVGEGELSGRFDPRTDEFISLDAIRAAKELRSDGPVIHYCVHCHKSLPHMLIPGDTYRCESCGTVNQG